jgi:hypothetical protein
MYNWMQGLLAGLTAFPGKTSTGYHENSGHHGVEFDVESASIGCTTGCKDFWLV